MGRLFTVDDGTIEAGHVHSDYKDGAEDVPSLRTLGTGAQQAAAGDHSHGGGMADGDYGDVLVSGSGTAMTVQSLGGVAFGTAATTAATDYATSGHSHAATYQPLDSDLTAIAALTTTGLVERTGSGTAAIRSIGINGQTTTAPAQPHLGFSKRCEWYTNGNSVTITAAGMPGPATTGTPTTRNVAAGSLFGWSKRCGFVSSSSSGQSAGCRLSVLQFGLGDVAGGGGFSFVCRFGVSDASTVANSRLFVGLQSSTTAIGNVEPSSLANLIGIGCDAGETNLSIIHNDASGTATKVPLGGGSNYPSQTLAADVYQLELYAAPNSSSVAYKVTRLGTAYSASGTLSSDLPAGTVLLAPQVWRNNGSTALAVGIDLFGLYIETEL